MTNSRASQGFLNHQAPLRPEEEWGSDRQCSETHLHSNRSPEGSSKTTSQIISLLCLNSSMVSYYFENKVPLLALDYRAHHDELLYCSHVSDLLSHRTPSCSFCPATPAPFQFFHHSMPCVVPGSWDKGFGLSRAPPHPHPRLYIWSMSSGLY